MKRLLLFVSIFAVCAGNTSAQSVIGATFPFGNPVERNSGMSMAMGGAANAVSSDFNLMLRNPANLATLDKTTLSALYSFDIVNSSEGSLSSTMGQGSPTQISIGFPVGSLCGLAVSYDKITDRRLAVKYDTSFMYNNNMASYSKGLVELGGIASWQVGVGRKIGSIAQIGVSYERAYYSAQNMRVESFQGDSLTIANPSRDSSKISCAFNGITGGITIPVGKLKLAFSGEYYFKTSAYVDSGLYYSNYNYSSGQYDSLSMVPGSDGAKTYDFRLPPSLCFGAAYEFSQEWLAASDVSMTFWNKAINYGVPVGDFKALNVAFGGQYIPAPNLLAPRYWEIIRYRAGFRYTQLPDPDAHETMLSLGVGLPVGGRSGIFDLTMEFGKRVDSKYSNLEENVFHIALGFNGGRKWSKSSRGNY